MTSKLMLVHSNTEETQKYGKKFLVPVDCYYSGFECMLYCQVYSRACVRRRKLASRNYLVCNSVIC